MRFFIPFIFLFLSTAILANEYLISYRYVVKDTIIYNEELDISPAMQPCKGDADKEYLILDTKKSKNLKKIIENNFIEFIDFINKLGLEIKYNSNTNNSINSSTTVVTLHTRCFKVDINEKFVRMAPLK